MTRRTPFLMRAHAVALLAGALGAALSFAACGSSGGGSSNSHASDAGVDADESVANDGAASADGDYDGAAPGEDAAPADAAADALGALDANGPPFPCGPTLVCFEVTQFCSQVTGPHGGVFYDCNAVPAPCVSGVSCACLAAQGITSPCSEADGGILVVAVE
jgi:hypothetical protein